MTGHNDQTPIRRLHPIHGMLLAATVPLFFCSLLSDIAYAQTYQIQWTNFASWLIAGGLVFAGLTLLWTIIDLVRADHRGHLILHIVMLLATWLVGFFNSLIHAKDAWAVMPMGLVLSVIVFLLACGATWIGFAKFGVGGKR
ncbi:DUF2231 domain-containing protein [Paraglaciecola chathamensis]|uniref:DUF2231 domain-containing protein n=1 Tax=Paraglaciecola chathamensis S18K6 TaxID=1127672 RepID=A0AAV3UW81_9ALTE|nr:DUF2231 domain-containing protein [Paraglaciecola chathamensis]GAC09344.1 hypothetical protein GCHA_1385 [Paraglaciecola chathamensis S18K6]